MLRITASPTGINFQGALFPNCVILRFRDASQWVLVHALVWENPAWDTILWGNFLRGRLIRAGYYTATLVEPLRISQLRGALWNPGQYISIFAITTAVIYMHADCAIRLRHDRRQSCGCVYESIGEREAWEIHQSDGWVDLVSQWGLGESSAKLDSSNASQSQQGQD